MFLTEIASKKRIEQLNVFNWLSKLVFSNGSEHVGNVIQWHKNSFFFKKKKQKRKIAQRLGILPPEPLAAEPPHPRLRYV